MGFWHVMLMGGVVIWTACVFLRAVAARTCQLRRELVPPVVETEDNDPSRMDAITISPSSDPATVTSVMGKPKSAGSGEGKPAGNGKHPGPAKPSHNGNGHAKVPVKRPNR